MIQDRAGATLREITLLNPGRQESAERASHAELAAFTALVDRNSTFLYRIAWSLLRNAHYAEDAVNDCLLKLFRTGGWKRSTDEKAFLARSCWRSALNRLPRHSVTYVEASDASLAPTGTTPESQAISSAEHERLHRLIDALPLQLREPLILAGFEELNSREIAVILKIPEGTVRTRIKRARDELRRRWQNQDQLPIHPRKEHADER